MSYSYHAKRRISIISSETNFSFLASYLTDLTDLAISLYYFPIPFKLALESVLPDLIYPVSTVISPPPIFPPLISSPSSSLPTSKKQTHSSVIVI